MTGATVALLLAGGLVTSTGSGLAVPDWPLSFGQVFPPMEGGVLFEHGHRLIAASVGLLMIALAAWYQMRERRPWVRRLAYLGLAAVVVQGILGGVTVLLRLPVAVSVTHACLAQSYFCLLVVLSHVTSRGVAEGSHPSRSGAATRPLRIFGVTATALVFGQLVLGALMRHTGAGLAIPDIPLAFGRIVPPFLSFEVAVHFAHRVGALLVAAAVIILASRALRGAARAGLIAPAVLALLLLVTQILLGATAVLTRLAVIPATLHLVTGALLLATCLLLTLRAWEGSGEGLMGESAVLEGAA